MSIWKFFTNQYLFLALILALGFWVRLYKIDNPVADWHSWRQADTAAVARNFYKERFNPFLPRYDDMSGVAQYPVPNPSRYRFVEFPIYPTLIYLTYLVNGGVDERLARLVNVIFSLGSTALVFFIARRHLGTATGLLSSLLFAILPFNVYFSRVILPEPSLVFFCLGMFYFTDRWLWEKSQKWYWASLTFTALAFLTKPMAVFYLLPLAYSYFKTGGKIWPVPIRLLVWLVLALAPFILWRVWMAQHPEGIPASNWLLNGNGIRFRPAFWRWILAERLGNVILTVPGILLFFVGAIVRPVKERWLMHLWLLSAFLYLAVVATGNVTHDYYQTLIIPPLVIFTARGFMLLVDGIPGFVARVWTVPVALLFLGLVPYLGWMEVKGFYQINNPVIVEAGREADRMLPKEAVVVAPYNGDTAFLYQTNRPGWANVTYPIKDLKDVYKVGYYISVNYDAKTKWVMKKYTVMVENPKFVIVDLRVENPEFYQKYNEPEPSQ